MNLCTYKCIHMHTDTHTHIHTHTHTHIHTHIYTHIHTHTQIHSHTYIHTTTLVASRWKVYWLAPASTMSLTHCGEMIISLLTHVTFQSFNESCYNTQQELTHHIASLPHMCNERLVQNDSLIYKRCAVIIYPTLLISLSCI